MQNFNEDVIKVRIVAAHIIFDAFYFK